MELKKHEVAMWHVDGEPDFGYPFYRNILRNTTSLLNEEALAAEMTLCVEELQRAAKGKQIGTARRTERGEAIELDMEPRLALGYRFGVAH
ncbi:hypothetical protein [Nocardiopsis sp. CA-288880]|uniref:hypothetical protein n=1 Tax=Nocardiopsis sp. CA-288880 TaxID=3239995 RepID=UPI003D979673